MTKIIVLFSGIAGNSFGFAVRMVAVAGMNFVGCILTISAQIRKLEDKGSSGMGIPDAFLKFFKDLQASLLR
jgi:hypothetical protein